MNILMPICLFCCFGTAHVGAGRKAQSQEEGGKPRNISEQQKPYRFIAMEMNVELKGM